MTEEEKLTRYEKARIIGARALQISMGAPSAVQTHENILHPIDIALTEFERGIIPVKVKRRAHSGLRNPRKTISEEKE
jgi:DNA-directed RNA polymerase subunit K